MRLVRLLAVGTLVLVAVYFGFRAIVAQCAGTACDAYIPVSLLIPVGILVMVAVTGVTAASMARTATTWFVVLLASTAVGVLGPIVALVVFRDNPDLFIPTAALLELLVVAVMLAYTFVGGRLPRPEG